MTINGGAWKYVGWILATLSTGFATGQAWGTRGLAESERVATIEAQVESIPSRIDTALDGIRTQLDDLHTDITDLRQDVRDLR